MTTTTQQQQPSYRIHWTAVLAVALAGSATFQAASFAAAQDVKESAKRYLGHWNNAKGIMVFAHPTAKLTGCEFVRSGGVAVNGKTQPGRFYLEYRYSWKGEVLGDTGTTNLVFFFNRAGTLTEIQTGRTTALVAPFAAAGFVLDLIKEEIGKDPEIRKDPVLRKLAEALAKEVSIPRALVLILNIDRMKS